MPPQQSSTVWVFLTLEAPVSAYERRLFEWKAEGMLQLAADEGWDVEVWGVRRRSSVEPPNVEIIARGPRLPELPPRVLFVVSNLVHFALALRHRRPGLLSGQVLVSFGAALGLHLTRKPSGLLLTVNTTSSGDGLRRRGHGVAARLVEVAERFVLHTADIVVTRGSSTRERAERAGVPDDRILELPRQAIWTRVGIEGGVESDDRDPRLILCAGRLVRQKGIDVLLRAVASVCEVVPDVKLEVAGDGEKRDELEGLAKELGISENVVFRGHLKGKFMPEFYERGRVVVLPSRSGEGLPLVLVEAGLAGCAAVGSDVQGINEIITPGVNGELVPPDDPDALAQVLVRLVQDPARVAELAEGGRRVASAHQARAGSRGDDLSRRIRELVQIRR